MGSSTPSPRVLIIGAGVSGLALANCLRRNNIPFTVFERDDQFDAFKAQGYRFKLRGFGTQALKDALDPDLFSLFENSSTIAKQSTVDRRNAYTGNPIPMPAHDIYFDSLSYAIDRTVLRKILRQGLAEEGDVIFNKSFTHYTFDEHSKTVTAHFADNTTASGILLVGADGYRSRVRTAHVPEFKTIDLGGRWIFGKTPVSPTDTAFNDFFPLTNFYMYVDHTGRDEGLSKGLLCERMHFVSSASSNSGKYTVDMPQDYVYWALSLNKRHFPEHGQDVSREAFHAIQASAVQRSKELTTSFLPELRELIQRQDPKSTYVARTLGSQVPLAPWEAKAYVTMIGDAIHPQPAVGAVGANNALRDAATLASAVIEHWGKDGQGWMRGEGIEAIKSYEGEMREEVGRVLKMQMQLAADRDSAFGELDWEGEVVV